MRSKKAKILGILIVLFAFALCSFNSIAATNPSITDDDPGTYIIVVMLMLFFLIIFSRKEELEFKYRQKDVAFGVAVFSSYLLLLVFSAAVSPAIFKSYRIDALLFPLPLAALILLVFGIDGLKKIRLVPLYALFASPLLLTPVIRLNVAFANLNALFIYNLLKVIGIPVTKNGLEIATSQLASITISTTCVSIGTFVAFVMFLLPIAYLYEGKTKSKALWMASGLCLMALLNVLRMAAISLEWAYYGIDKAVGMFHAIGGQMLFYATIAAMILMAGRCGLRFATIRVRQRERQMNDAEVHALAIPALLAIAFSVIGFVLSARLV